MHINYTGHHIEITPALKLFTEEKLAKLERHFNQIHSIDVFFTVEKLVHTVEATVAITKAKFNAHAEADNMYTAIDELVQKLEHQLIKHKDKLLAERGK